MPAPAFFADGSDRAATRSSAERADGPGSLGLTLFLVSLAVLFLGTIVEAAAVIPLDIMIRRKTSCYCAEWTFFSLTALWSVGLLVLGPAVCLLPFGRRRKRINQGRCPACGYDRHGLDDETRCPECGAGWRDDTR